MGGETLPQVDDDARELLRRFFAAPDEREAQSLLERLIREHADPVIKAVLRRRMGVYLDYVWGLDRNCFGRTTGNPPKWRSALDAEDVHASALLSLLERLQALKGSVEAEPIRDFHGYVAGIAAHAFAMHLRRLYPERHRLRRRLWDLCRGGTSVTGFALWPGRSPGETLCGFQAWLGQPLRATRSYETWRLQPARFQREALLGDDPRQIAFPELVARVLDWVGSPMDVDDLINGMAELLGLTQGERSDG